MPYRRIGKKIYTKATGRWRLKQTCRTVSNAIKALKLLRGIEHGTLVSRKKKRRKRK